MDTSKVEEQITKQKLRMLELYQAKEDISTELASIIQIIHSLEFALSTDGEQPLINTDNIKEA
jgi:hypothetical protein